MRWNFWKWPVPAPSGECAHMWSNWSEPDAVRVKTFHLYLDPTERDGWAQDRHCLLCNIYERRVA